MRRFAILFSLSFILACGGGDTGEETGDETSTETGLDDSGGVIYLTPVEGGNSFACATCHAIVEPAADGFTRPGHPTGDATRRPHWKNGKVDTMLAAVNSCRTEWMNADPWAEDDPDWLLLYNFLDAQATEDEADPITISIVQPPEDLSGGDPVAGLERFNTSCVVCHGAGAVGTNMAPPLAGTGLDPEYIAQRIRLSGKADSSVYDGLLFGIMPFWGDNRLSDEDLIDIVAWVSTSELPGEETGDEETGDEDTGAEETGDEETGAEETGAEDTGAEETGDETGGGCGKTHPKVGWTAEFQTIAHGVKGTATILDDCTVEIEHFIFDGNGITVEVYLAEDLSSLDDGISISDNLYNFPVGYDDVTLTYTIPDDLSLDDVGAISIWCIDVGFSFGHGAFTAP